MHLFIKDEQLIIRDFKSLLEWIIFYLITNYY